jgi:hypothetical protein
MKTASKSSDKKIRKPVERRDAGTPVAVNVLMSISILG